MNPLEQIGLWHCTLTMLNLLMRQLLDINYYKLETFHYDLFVFRVSYYY